MTKRPTTTAGDNPGAGRLVLFADDKEPDERKRRALAFADIAGWLQRYRNQPGYTLSINKDFSFSIMERPPRPSLFEVYRGPADIETIIGTTAPTFANDDDERAAIIAALEYLADHGWQY